MGVSLCPCPSHTPVTQTSLQMSGTQAGQGAARSKAWLFLASRGGSGCGVLREA